MKNELTGIFVSENQIREEYHEVPDENDIVESAEKEERSKRVLRAFLFGLIYGCIVGAGVTWFILSK